MRDFILGTIAYLLCGVLTLLIVARTRSTVWEAAVVCDDLWLLTLLLWWTLIPALIPWGKLTTWSPWRWLSTYRDKHPTPTRGTRDE